MIENKETNKYLPYIKELFPNIGKDPKKDFEFCLKTFEKNFDRKQLLSLRALCFFTQEVNKEIATELGQIDKKNYKNIFISNKNQAAKILWELQNEFTSQETFRCFNNEYLLRDMIIGAFRSVKFGNKRTLEDYQLCESITKSCCFRSGIDKSIIEIIPSYLHEQADKLNHLGGISDQVAKNFIEKHHGSWGKVVLKKKFSRFILKTKNFLNTSKNI